LPYLSWLKYSLSFYRSENYEIHNFTENGSANTTDFFQQPLQPGPQNKGLCLGGRGHHKNRNTVQRWKWTCAAKKAAITVISEQDKQELLSGTTDDQGFFSFPIPEAAKKNRYNLEIIANSGDGHKNSWHLSAADYLQIEENSVSQPPPPLLPVPPHQPIQLDQLNQHRVSACVLDEQQLTRIIESTLEKKLAPVKRSLAMQQETGPSLQDILGGIGYILGLAGITAYFKSQKKKP